MDCETFREWLHPWVDGELDLPRGLEMERHAMECPSCLTEESALRGLRLRLSQTDLGFQPPDRLRARIQTLLEAESVPAAALARRPSTGRRPWIRSVSKAWAGALAVILVLASLLIWDLSRRKESDLDGLERELVDNHFRSLQASHLMDVASTDQHTVKPWFAGKLDFSPPVENLAELGFPLAGGRLDFVRTLPVAALVYHRKLHVINVYCWPAQSADIGGETLLQGQSRGCHVLMWKQGDFRWGVVSDLNEAELRQFVQLLRNRANPPRE